MIDRLKIDHENARFLAEKLTKIGGVSIDLKNVQTSMVTFDLDPSIDCNAFLQKLKENGILALAQAKNRVRIVTHRGIERVHVETVAATIDRILNRN
jgi:threonine aldolase